MMSLYKNTLNLPRTAFPARARLAEREPRMVARFLASRLSPALCLAEREPRMLARWEKVGLYDKVQAARKRSPIRAAGSPPRAVLNFSAPHSQSHKQTGEYGGQTR